MLKVASAFYPSIKFVQANPIEKEFPLHVSLSHVDMPHARLAKYLSVEVTPPPQHIILWS